MSILPGIVCWLIVAVIEVVARPDNEPSSLASGTCAAMFLVSTVPWALSVRLPRYAVSIGWVLLASMSIALIDGGDANRWSTSPGRRWSDARGAITFLVYPVSAVGRELRASDVPLVLPGLAAAVGTMIAACWWVVRADYPLEASQ